VSVVIPSYNRAYIVGQAIESALQQTHRPVEVLVADDGSTDDTRRVVEGYGPPVRYFYQPNAGVSAARNLGLRHARGEFIALLDSDDWWLPWKVEAQVRLLRAFPDVGMVWTDMAAVDEAGKLVSPAFIRTKYSNFRRYPVEQVMRAGGTLGAVWPGAPPGAAGRPFYHGDIFSEMILGSLVHTSTVLFRRERLA